MLEASNDNSEMLVWTVNRVTVLSDLHNFQLEQTANFKIFK
jgi:hypothetical protein